MVHTACWWSASGSPEHVFLLIAAGLILVGADVIVSGTSIGLAAARFFGAWYIGLPLGLLASVHQIGGPPVKPYQPEGYYAPMNFPKREYAADVGEGLYRRGVYTHWQRTLLLPSFVAFDAPARDECTANRSTSNTPSKSARANAVFARRYPIWLCAVRRSVRFFCDASEASEASVCSSSLMCASGRFAPAVTSQCFAHAFAFDGSAASTASARSPHSHKETVHAAQEEPAPAGRVGVELRIDRSLRRGDRPDRGLPGGFS